MSLELMVRGDIELSGSADSKGNGTVTVVHTVETKITIAFSSVDVLQTFSKMFVQTGADLRCIFC